MASSASDPISFDHVTKRSKEFFFDILSRVNAGEAQEKIAKEFKVTPSCVCKWVSKATAKLNLPKRDIAEKSGNSGKNGNLPPEPPKPPVQNIPEEPLTDADRITTDYLERKIKRAMDNSKPDDMDPIKAGLDFYAKRNKVEGETDHEDLPAIENLLSKLELMLPDRKSAAGSKPLGSPLPEQPKPPESL